MKSLILSNQSLLEQAISFVASLGEQDYVRSYAEVFSSSIGQHVRHCVEHYEEFIHAVRDERELDYEKRPRDASVETNPRKAIHRLETIRNSLGSSISGCRAIVIWDNALETSATSSVSRELHFLLSHTVHHFALIGVIASLAGLRVPKGFGVAPSTLKFRESA